MEVTTWIFKNTHQGIHTCLSPFTPWEIQIYELFTVELGSVTNSVMPPALITVAVWKKMPPKVPLLETMTFWSRYDLLGESVPL